MHLRFLLGLAFCVLFGAHAWAQAPCPIPNPNTTAWTSSSGPNFQGLDSASPVACPLPASGLNAAFSALWQHVTNTITAAIVCPVLGQVCVVPTGVAATDTAAIQAAVNTDYTIVRLLPGTLTLNAKINVPHRNVTVEGWNNTYPAGLGGSTPPYPAATTVDCSAIVHSGVVGCFTVTNQSAHFSGFRIYGNANNGLNCISDGDAGLVVDGHMQLENCFIGLYIDTGVGTTTGFALNPVVHDVSIPYAYQFGIYCNSSCTDGIFGPNIATEVAGLGNTGSSVSGTGAIGMGPNSLHNTIQGNFLADSSGSPCLWAQGGYIAFVGNTCGNSVALAAFGGAFDLQYNDNTAFSSTVLGQAVQFAGTNSQVQMNNNFFFYGYTACYLVASGGSLVGYTQFSNNTCIVFSGFNNALYNDTFTETAIDPFAYPKQINGGGAQSQPGGAWATLTNTTGPISAPDWAQSLNVIIPLVHGVTNSLPNPIYTSSGQTGLFGVKQSATGTDTVGSYGSDYIGTFASPSTGAGITDVYSWTTTVHGNILIGAKVGSIPLNN